MAGSGRSQGCNNSWPREYSVFILLYFRSTFLLLSHPWATFQPVPVIRVLDGLGLVGEVERVAEHHGDGEDGADGVDDALAGDVGGGACTSRKYVLITS